MPMIPASSSAKRLSDFSKRGAWAHEHGVLMNQSVDQSANLLAFIENVVGRHGSALDLGYGFLPSGTIPVASTVGVTFVAGIYLRGAGTTDGIAGPRNHPGWSSSLSGTQIYWTGAAGGTVMSFSDSKAWVFELCDLYLGESTASAHAAVGILFFTGTLGQGKTRLHRINIISPTFGNTGIQIGSASGETNNDSGIFSEIHFRALDTCVHQKSAQNLAHRFESCEMHQCRRFLYCQEGGQSFISNLHVVNSNSPGTIVIVECDSGGFLAGHHEIRGGYVDRQTAGQDVTIFDYRTTTALRCDGHVSDFDLRPRNGGTSYGSTPAIFELSNQSTVLAENCNLGQQPVVRFNSTLTSSQLAQVRLTNCSVSVGRIAGDLVQAVGGYCGIVDFETCRRHTQVQPQEVPFTASVGRPAAGSEDTHYDIDDFDGSHTLNFAGSWLNLNHTVVGYWRLNDAEGSTTIANQASGGTLTVESDVIEPRGPLGLLGPRCANWFKQSTGLVDTGISLSPASTSYTFFGWIYLDNLQTSGNQVVWSHAPASGSRMRIWQIDSSANLYNGVNGAVDYVTTLPLRRWLHLITCYDRSTDGTTNYINGTQYASTTTAGIAATSTGNLNLGGDTSANCRCRLSRMGVLSGTLTSAQASQLCLAASVQATKPVFRP